MHKGVCGGLAAIALLWVAGWSRGDSLGAGTNYAHGDGISGGLITHHLPGGPEGDHLVVIDQATRAVAVYRVHSDRGQIVLTSARRIDSDLKLLSFNTERPLPEEIEAGLKRQEF